MEETAVRGETPGETENRPEAAESWYQLLAQEDASVMPTLSETDAHVEHTDLPSMEEGSLQLEIDLGKPTSAGRTRSLYLDIQDSRLSPCLPLLTSDSTPGHKFFEDTLFHHTETDFAPLRGSLDISEFPGSSSKLLQMSDAVELANKEILLDQVDRNFSVSQHYLGVSLDRAGDVSSVQYLSQHPLSFSHGDKGDHILTEYAGNESGVLKPVASQEIIKPSIEELRREDGSFLGSNVPAPVLLELLEKEVAMSGSSRASSRRSSQSVSENIDVQQQEPVRKQHEVNWSEPRVQADTGSLSESLLQEGSFPDSSEKVVLDIMKREKVDLHKLNEFNQSGGVVHQTIRQTVQPNKDDLHKQMCSEIQQRYQEKEMSKAIENRRESSSPRSGPVLTKSCTETPYKSNDTVEAHLSDETAISSRSSIERGHKDTEMSRAGNTPMDETSFIDKLAHPISQSTPGTFSMNRKHLSGRIQQIKAKLTGSEMSLDEEPSGGTSNLNVVTKVVPQSVQSSQGYPESSDSQRSLSPQRRRIQSLPSLNYIEKVGAWNTNQSFDALVLRGLTGVSPKKLAFDAVASSLNRMLSKQTSGTVPKKGLAASFKCTSSMSNLDVKESESSTVSQLTRSQSYNSVIPVRGKDTSEMWTEAAVQPVAEEVHQISRSNKVQSYKALRGVSTIPSRDNNEVEQNNRAPSVGLYEVSEVQSRPECTKTEDKSHHKQEKELDKSTLNHHENIVTLDQFSDVSLDHEFSSSSNSNDLLKEMLLDSAASSKHELTSLDVDNFAPFWAPTEKTPEEDELNIEDRIPMYLRNLGINQSPKTILTPFAPKGPIREPEFSPTDLRTIKGSTATPSRSMRLSDGGSQTGANISQSSLYSSASTTSVSIPMGSVAGPESPLATETSPQFTADRPISQDDFVTKDVQSGQEVFSFLTLVREKSEMSPDVQPTIDINSAPPVSQVLQYDESTHVKQLIEQFEYGGYDGGQENTSSLTGNLRQVSLSSLQSASKQPLTMDSVNDSFVGSKTLKEIRKLLAEADDVGLDSTSSGLYLTSPLRDSVSPPVGLNLEDSLKSDTLNSRSASPLDLLLKDMSWDTSFNSSVTSDDVVKKVSSVNADLHSGDHSGNGSPVKDISYLAELVEDRNRLAAPVTLHKRWGRSEPEGSSEASANKVMASTVQVQDHHNKGGDVIGKVQRTEQLLSSVTSSVGNLKHTLALTGPGYIRGREVESDESSGDSLAARITSLLKTDTLFPSAGRVIQTTEEDGGRPQRSVQLRLVSQPMMTDTDLSEEDRRRIEEIKKELLDGAKRALTDRCYSHVGSREPAATRDTDHFRLQMTPSPFHGQLHVTSSHDSLENSAVQPLPTIGDEANGAQQSSTGAENLKDPVILTYHQQHPTTELQTPEQWSRTYRELDAPAVLPVKLHEDTTKPIASITFASRKRSSLRSVSPTPKAGGSEPSHSGSQNVVFGQSSNDLDFRKKPTPVTSRPNNVSHVILEQDVPVSHRAGEDVVQYPSPMTVLASQNQPNEARSHQLSAPILSLDTEYSSSTELNLPCEENSLPTFERSSRLIPLEMENAIPGHDTLQTPRSVASSLDKQIKGLDADLSKSYNEPIRVEKTHTNGADQSSSQKLRPKSANVSSPTMKALSCIHVTISPKEDFKVLDVSNVVESDAANESPACGLRTNPEMPALPSANLSGNDQVLFPGKVTANSSYFMHSAPKATNGEIKEDVVQMVDKEDTPERLSQSDRRRWPLSDATTQITTESPEKTSFSAEIFIDGTPKEVSASLGKPERTPERWSQSSTPISSLCRATDQPLLIPYKPPGSPELFYVPRMDGGFRTSPVSTIESSHPGSNDAMSPKFPAEILGSATEKLSDPSIPRHKDGIYSKDQGPRIAWDQSREQRKTPTGFHDDLELSKNLHHKAKQTHMPGIESENEFGGYSKASYGTLQPRGPQPAAVPRERSDNRREKYHLRSSFEDSEFYPLQAEVDSTAEQQSDIMLPLRYKSLESASELTRTKKTDYTGPSFQITDVPGGSHKNGQTLGNQSYSPTSSWDTKKREVQEDGSSSSSRANHLQEGFQKPESTPSHTIVSNQSLDELWARFTDRKKSQLSDSSSKLEISLVERLDRLAKLLRNPAPYSLQSPKDAKNGAQVLNGRQENEQRWETKKTDREKQYRKKSEVKPQNVSRTLTRDEMEISNGSMRELSQSKSYGNVSSGGSLYSGLSSKARSSTTESAHTDSETATQTNSEASTGMRTSSSMSTIDTVRLIKAFGPERVRPSSKLSRLYSTIDLQKKRTVEISKKQKSPKKMADTDSVMSSNGSWEPSPALRHKRSGKVLNKGIQTGELEIVMSATRKNTRDVGTTFPSPGGELTVTCAQGSPGQRGSLIHQPLQPGLSWFVPTDDVKSDDRKENKRTAQRGPGPVWFEPMSNAKPWREPLREKNEQDEVPRRADHLLNRSQLISDAQSKSPRPFVKITLQESLKTHRPKFIFRSGERVKRLRLLAKERKLQNMFQNERDELFNQPVPREVSNYQNPYKDSRKSQRNDSIPRKEMVQRSKRIYEQLPEIKRRKEEEKRRCEYESYRLKAQLFRKKVTNNILGRKTPWN